jgi:hypothetical protein
VRGKTPHNNPRQHADQSIGNNVDNIDPRCSPALPHAACGNCFGSTRVELASIARPTAYFPCVPSPSSSPLLNCSRYRSRSSRAAATCLGSFFSFGAFTRAALIFFVYNPVRLAMLRQAHDHGVSVTRISFVDALRWVGCRLLGLDGVATLRINPHRPGRRDPRVIRRRLKEYNLMKRPRAELKGSETYGENR